VATGTLFDMFLPNTAENVGTPRVERIANEPFDTQIRNSGLSVMDAMLSAARDKVVEIASGTAVGQDLIAAAQQQQQQAAVQKYAPLILIGILILVFFAGRAFSRG
jgi:hypothetical protein